MIYEIEITDQAELDLRNIYEYIAYELQSPQSALSQLNRLEKDIMSLSHMPLRFRKYENELWNSRGLRIICRQE